MNPQLFGVEHILYIVISTILGAGGLLAAKKWAKTEKNTDVRFERFSFGFVYFDYGKPHFTSFSL